MIEYIEMGIKVIHARDSKFNSTFSQGNGYVAVQKDGSEFYGDTKKQAFQQIIKVRGSKAIGEWNIN